VRFGKRRSVNEADTNLWRAWTRRRDEDAFATLVRPHLKFASDFARRLGCDAADADDLVQQALTKLASEQTDRPLQVGLRPWLGRFLVLNHKMLRRSGARRSRYEASAPQRQRDAHADSDSREAVEALLAGLPEPQRESIVLR